MDQYRAVPLACRRAGISSRLVRMGTVWPSSQARGREDAADEGGQAKGAGRRWAKRASTVTAARPTRRGRGNQEITPPPLRYSQPPPVPSSVTEGQEGGGRSRWSAP